MNKKLLLLTLSATGLLSTQPALANNNSQSDVEAKLNSMEWKGLKPARNGGPNVSHVDKASLTVEELKAIRSLEKDERVKECSVYKLVYEKMPLDKPKVLPNTGNVVGYGHLVGAGVLAGLTFYLLRNKRGRKMLVIMLVGGSSLVYTINDTNAFSGTIVAPTILVASNNVLNAPEIDGYRFVGVIEMEGVCLVDPTPNIKPKPKPKPLPDPKVTPDPKPDPKPSPDPKVTPDPKPDPKPSPDPKVTPDPELPRVKPGTPSPACPPTMNPTVPSEVLERKPETPSPVEPPAVNPNIPSEVPERKPGTPSPACPPTMNPTVPSEVPERKPGTPSPAYPPTMAPSLPEGDEPIISASASSLAMSPFTLELATNQKDEFKKLVDLI